MVRVVLGKWRGPTLLALSLWLSGCAGYPAASPARVPNPLPAQISERFAYAPQAIHNASELLEQAPRNQRWDVRFSLRGDPALDGQALHLEYYRLPQAQPAPVIVVLPILAGKRNVARNFADYFARHGFAAVIVHSEQKHSVLVALEDLEGAVRESVLRHRLALDWVAAQPELDASRLGVFGASMGALNGFYLSALDPRVRASVLALAAGDLPYVLAHSQERRVAKAVGQLRQDRDLSPEQVEAFLAATLQTDPLDLAPHVDPASLLLIMARFDDVLAYSRQRALRRALGEPEAVVLPTGHVTAALYLPYLRYRALAFFRRRLLSE